MAGGRGVPKKAADGEKEGPSVSELFRQLARDSGALLRQEIELAKSELAASLRRTAVGAGWLAGGAAVVLLAVLVLVAALVVALGDLLDRYWLAALIVGLLFVVVGGALAAAAAKRLKTARLKPEATLEMLREDRRWAQTELHQVKHELTRSPE